MDDAWNIEAVFEALWALTENAVQQGGTRSRAEPEGTGFLGQS
jgi:hypothetical protein